MFEKLITDLINDLIASEHTEGALMLFVWSVIILLVQLKYQPEYTKGLKGADLLFQASEIALHLFFWYSPHVVMYSAFLQVTLPEGVWYFMIANLIFAFLGRMGLERVISLRLGSGTTTTKEFKKEVITESNEKTE